MKYFDLHCDSVAKSLETGESVYNGDLQLNCVKGKNLKKWKQCFSLWLDDRLKGQAAFSYCNELYMHYLYEMGNMYAQGAKNLTPILTIENGSALGGNINNIAYWKNRGVRMLTLTWNGDNELASGVKGNLKRGLTAFGKQCIKEMEKQGIAVDVSHLNEKSFRDVSSYVTLPIVASHSNCYDVFPHPRNLKKYQLEFIKDTGGLIGLCFYNQFLTEENENLFSCILKNIEYLLELGCEKNIALGSDFDGCENSFEIKGIQSIPQLYFYLREKGINEKTLENIFYNNSENFFNSLLFRQSVIE